MLEEIRIMVDNHEKVIGALVIQRKELRARKKSLEAQRSVWCHAKHHVREALGRNEYQRAEDVRNDQQIANYPKRKQIIEHVDELTEVTAALKEVEAMVHFSGGAIRTEDGNFHFSSPVGTYRYWADAESGESSVVEITVENVESVEDVRLVIEVIGRVGGNVEGLLDEETVHVCVDGVRCIGSASLTNGNFQLTGYR